MRYFIGSAALMLLISAAIIGSSETTDTVDPAAAPADVDAIEATPVMFANVKCPIMVGQPSAELTTEYVGKTIGFCCDGCPEKWEALSDAEKAERVAEGGVREKGSEGVAVLISGLPISLPPSLLI